MERFGLTQEEAAERVGKSRTAVANILRILKLPEKVLALVEDGSLSYGHARALIPLTQVFDSETVFNHAEIIIKNQMSVRQTEQYVRSAMDIKEPKPENEESNVSKAYYKKLENDISESLGRKIAIKRDAEGKGKISLSFADAEDLELLIKQLCGNNFFNNED